MEINYDVSNVNHLLKEINVLIGFESVKEWDNKAKKEIDLINETLNKLNPALVILKDQLVLSKKEHQNKPFLKKIISFDKVSKDLILQINKIIEIQENLQETKDVLEDYILKTPDSEDESKIMLKELKFAKKELNTLKKEKRSEIRQINTNARVQNSNISNQFIFSSPKLKRLQRVGVRSQKESALKPHEHEIFNIDKQLLEIDKTIIWIEKIKF